ncbi:ribosomal DNA transcription factor Rrn3 [Schizosaccharomyces japonicus yFS275]|uniref:Ribosomal DNA transcription factor Rrn3 n=1 Tax=Schizosaccharomyces japonicus (strain yFS275 / FY16936) TaxID=402676 RepID=B6JYS6_SCHJY|nr:ribosomal DNA transcription factor Rrn3 [Schizosaccharomyces japonicus yFS275]EEB06694.1 ribosomal DNA transcription factor Rrn3 [Schizosaccharomyces japonicus yFS275]
MPSVISEASQFPPVGPNRVASQQDADVFSAVGIGADLSSFGADTELLKHMFSAFVGKALDDYAQGNPSAYEDMCRQFSAAADADDAPSSSQLQNLLMALTRNVSRLDSSCSSLISSILSTNWSMRDDAFVSSYVRFLGNLLSAQSTYMPLVMTMIVQQMCFQPSSQSVQYERAHLALKYVLDLVPRAHSHLYNTIIEEFPYKDESLTAQMTYISNILSICEYVPSIKGHVIRAIIDKLIQVDVELHTELEDFDEEEDDDDDEDVDSESEKSASDDLLTASTLYELHESANGETAMEPMSMDVPETSPKLLVEQLDQLLYMLFAYLDSNLSPINVDREIVYNYLINSFVSTVLNTFQSRYVQFLIFWASQKDPEFTDILLGVLTEVCLDPSKSCTIRISSAMYIGSYVARAKSLDPQTIRVMVNMLCRWIEAYLDQYEDDKCEDLLSKHSVCYAIIQSVFYIFCFRWKELKLSSENDSVGDKFEWLPGLAVLQRAVLSRLNPLRFCSTNVVQQFAKVANHLNFLYVFTIIEHNRKSTIREGFETIDCFFPFDPLRLPKVLTFVQPYYNEWRPIPGMDDDDDDDLSDASDSE